MRYLLFIFIGTCLSFTSKEIGNLSLQISNVETTTGTLSIGIYDTSETFCKDYGFVFAQDYTISQTGIVEINIPNLPYGTYALAMYHDVNGNGKIDKNILGIPKEPYAFSNDVRAKWSEPSFDATKFTLTSSFLHHELEIRYWKDQ